MSKPDRTTFSRRAALKTGGIAALAAGMLAGPDSKPVVASVVDVVNFPSLTEDSLIAVKKSETALRALLAEQRRLRDELGASVMDRVQRFIENEHDNERDAWVNLVVAELARHLPGMAPAIYAIVEHIYDDTGSSHGRCCV